MMKQVLVKTDVGIDNLPDILNWIISFNIGRKVPLTETAAYSSNFINVSILPRKQAMGGWRVV